MVSFQHPTVGTFHGHGVCVQVLLLSTKFVLTNIVKYDFKCVCVFVTLAFHCWTEQPCYCSSERFVILVF